jgi:hypothetical protein
MAPTLPRPHHEARQSMRRDSRAGLDFRTLLPAALPAAGPASIDEALRCWLEQGR